ncbi:NADPH-dependent ferric-chelate reductase [Streptomyces sp. YIM 130001]|uniref:siderophore-interacting protein n=1 Tax=Streptomyces sp. YIM 130001 TaxID=2259644 RepID=UPI000E64BA96|nr:siderophore-interacting protein [Streptomyces sp. YIM 130001]RII17113.1 NADPH-dependent ferric-chelate reductase [Streptomyces sp. YIM 130001]
MAGRRHQPFPICIRELEVLEVFNVTPLMRRVVLTGEQLGAFRNNGIDVGPFHTDNADDHVKLVIPGDDPDFPGMPQQVDGTLDWPAGGLAYARDYTPRYFDAEAGRLELDFVRHSGGLAAGWAEDVTPGERVHVAGPRGTTVLPDGIDWYFLVGDETALPAIARRIEELPPGTPVTAVISVPRASEEQTFRHATDLDITWVHSDRSGPDDLMRAVEAAPWRDGQVYAWAAGEANMLRPLRRWFSATKQVPRDYTDIAGYWRAGQTQMEVSLQRNRIRHMADLGTPYVLRAAVSLDIAELVSEGHRTVEALANATGADVRGLRRLVRLLAHDELGVLTRAEDGTLGLGPAGPVLQEPAFHERLDHRGGYSRIDDGWPGLLHALRTGESGFQHVKGRSFWEELGSDDELGRTFDQALSGWTNDWAPPVAKQLDLTDEHVVDVGGGTGVLLAEILEQAPDTRGTLIELPTTAERGVAQFAARGLADRARVVPQSFFEQLPDDGDVYLISQVLHDWPDAESTAILRRAAEAAGAGTVALLERLAKDSDDDHEMIFDLQMYALFGSGERSQAEYTALAAEAGLVPTAAHRIHEDLHLLLYRNA